ncbi:transposase [candidate division TA06 bacterium]|uniref:Transposase n=1 Tax=candidate division TA06 bacterium TaxID=2250710 RepID=A0A933IBH6_UNCT6|nr:transposase [candidate division TA06 bacterium]
MTFLKEISQRHPTEYIIMFLDGASWHQAHHLSVPVNIRLSILPPDSPELNPTEHLWDEIREKWFPNRVFNSLAAVEDTLVDSLVTLENDHKSVKGLIGFDWIIDNISNAF